MLTRYLPTYLSIYIYQNYSNLYHILYILYILSHHRHILYILSHAMYGEVMMSSMVLVCMN